MGPAGGSPVGGGELSLTSVVKLCEALEIGKLSQELVSNNSGSINRMSEYRQNKDGKRQQDRKDQASANRSQGRVKVRAVQISDQGSMVPGKSNGGRIARPFMRHVPSAGSLGITRTFCRGGTGEQSGKSLKKSRGKVTAVSAEPEPDKEMASLEGLLGTLTGSRMGE